MSTRFKVNRISSTLTGSFNPVYVAAPALDPNLAMLFHFNDTNGSKITTDSGPYNLSSSFVGTTVISTADSKFGGASLYSDGTSGNYFQITGSQTQNLWISASANFTFEFWIKMMSGAGSYAGIMGFNIPSGVGNGFQILILSSQGKLYFEWQGNVIALESTTGLITNDNTWRHIAVVRNGTGTNNVVLYIDGVNRIQGTANNAIVPTEPFKLFTSRDNGSYISAYIDEVRWSRVARYTGNFTPPTTAFSSSI